MPERFDIDPWKESHGRCDCCGHESRCIWGFASGAHDFSAAYYVNWTVGDIDAHPPNFDFIVGAWGDGTTARDRVLASLGYKLLDTGPSFRVIDAVARLPRYANLAATALQRSDIVGQPVAAHIFAAADAVLVRDVRVKELLGGWTIQSS